MFVHTWKNVQSSVGYIFELWTINGPFGSQLTILSYVVPYFGPVYTWSTLFLEFSSGDWMCSTHIWTKPLKSPMNRLQIKRNNGRILHFISSFVTRISSSASVSISVESTSPTTWANSLYNGSSINSTKLRWAELCGGFFVNLRLKNENERSLKSIETSKIIWTKYKNVSHLEFSISYVFGWK